MCQKCGERMAGSLHPRGSILPDGGTGWCTEMVGLLICQRTTACGLGLNGHINLSCQEQRGAAMTFSHTNGADGFTAPTHQIIFLYCERLGEAHLCRGFFTLHHSGIKQVSHLLYRNTYLALIQGAGGRG